VIDSNRAGINSEFVFGIKEDVVRNQCWRMASLTTYRISIFTPKKIFITLS